jgi:hypothetical protein
MTMLLSRERRGDSRGAVWKKFLQTRLHRVANGVD